MSEKSSKLQKLRQDANAIPKQNKLDMDLYTVIDHNTRYFFNYLVGSITTARQLTELERFFHFKHGLIQRATTYDAKKTTENKSFAPVQEYKGNVMIKVSHNDLSVFAFGHGLVKKEKIRQLLDFLQELGIITLVKNFNKHKQDRTYNYIYNFGWRQSMKYINIIKEIRQTHAKIHNYTPLTRQPKEIHIKSGAKNFNHVSLSDTSKIYPKGTLASIPKGHIHIKKNKERNNQKELVVPEGTTKTVPATAGTQIGTLPTVVLPKNLPTVDNAAQPFKSKKKTSNRLPPIAVDSLTYDWIIKSLTKSSPATNYKTLSVVFDIVGTLALVDKANGNNVFLTDYFKLLIDQQSLGNYTYTSFNSLIRGTKGIVNHFLKYVENEMSEEGITLTKDNKDLPFNTRTINHCLFLMCRELIEDFDMSEQTPVLTMIRGKNDEGKYVKEIKVER